MKLVSPTLSMTTIAKTADSPNSSLCLFPPKIQTLFIMGKRSPTRRRTEVSKSSFNFWAK